ncbi:replication initiation protein, partial [Campylobacter jejuni]
MKTTKKTNKKKIQKAVVTQNNRFVYAKYDMNTNELKMFMWIVAQINSQKDTLFQVCEIPLSQIFEVLNHKSAENYTYIINLIDSMA